MRAGIASSLSFWCAACCNAAYLSTARGGLAHERLILRQKQANDGTLSRRAHIAQRKLAPGSAMATALRWFSMLITMAGIVGKVNVLRMGLEYYEVRIALLTSCTTSCTMLAQWPARWPSSQTSTSLAT